MTQQEINNASMLKVGTILHGTYRIDRYLSSGGFGNTYVATNIEFEERVAIKEFFMKGVTQRDGNHTTVSVSNAENSNSFFEQKEKFKKEARRIRLLRNLHIVNVHDLFEENGTAYYVMGYVDGENLAERLKKTGRPMTESEVRLILPQILDALKTVHDADIWHLDLKPANIMIDKAGNVKLIDFGASKQLNAQKGGATTSTAISYTNGYAPREQMEQNYDKFGPWTDIYALGATLYNLLTNKRPPLPSDIDDDISEDKHVALPFPEGIGDLRFLVLQMMKTNRLQRPQSIVEIMNANKTRKEESNTDYDEETIIADSKPRTENERVKSKAQDSIPSLSDFQKAGLLTNSRNNRLFLSSIFPAICSFVIGVLLLKYPDGTSLFIIFSVGGLIMLSGIFSLIIYMYSKKHIKEYVVIDNFTTPVAAGCYVLLGLFLALSPSIFITGLMYVLAFILILGIINQLVCFISARRVVQIPIFYYILPLFIILLGLYVILKPISPAALSLLIIGWCYLLCGVSEIIYILKIKSILKQAECLLVKD